MEYEFKNFNSFFLSLVKALQVYTHNDKFIQDSIIFRFRHTFDCSFVLLKSYMEEQGLNFEVSFPKTVIKEAYANHLIDNEDTWLSMMNDRNTSSHMYDPKIADRIVKNIKDKYINEFDNLLKKLKEEL